MKKRPIDRSANPVRDANLVVIASEDRYAVRQYFDFFKSTRIQFKVLETQDCRSSPTHVLDRIDAYKKEFQIGEGDSFWIVVDCDHWIEPNHVRNLRQVLSECRRKDVEFALSNPCFELWLLLHFSEFPAEDQLSCDEVAVRLRAAAGMYDKTKVYRLPIDGGKVRTAIGRAATRYDSSQEIPTGLQTAVHRIVESLIERNVISVRDESAVVTPTKPRGAKSRRRK